MKPAKKAPSEPTRARARTSSRGFTAEERAAMREHVRWEERELFPRAEALLDLPRLQEALHRPAEVTP